MMQTGDIVYNKFRGNYLLILSKSKVLTNEEKKDAYAYRYRCLDLTNGGHVVSFLPKGFYKRAA